MKIQAKVVILYPMTDEAGVQRLREDVDEVVVVPTLDLDRLQAESQDAHFLFVGLPMDERDRIRAATGRLIREGKRLKGLGVVGRVLDLLDLEAAAERKLPIIYSQLYGDTMSEYILALMLCSARKIQYLGEALRRGRFTYDMRRDWMGSELAGKTVGIVGFGHIGRCVARKCRYGFNMTVLAHDPYMKQHQADEFGARLVPGLAALLGESDYVCVTAVCTTETRHLIGQAELRQMKKTAYLINTTPSVVDEKALIETLEEEGIAGASLDVFDPDPPHPDNPLFRFPNVIVTPHMAGFTRESFHRMALDHAEQIIALLRREAASGYGAD